MLTRLNEEFMPVAIRIDSVMRNTSVHSYGIRFEFPAVYDGIQEYQSDRHPDAVPDQVPEESTKVLDILQDLIGSFL